MQEEVDVELDTAENMSTVTQSDQHSRPFSRHWDGAQLDSTAKQSDQHIRPFSRHWDGAQPDIAAQDGDDWWNYLQEVSAEQSVA